MELLFLGTGAGVPAKHRNVSSIALIAPEYKGEIWLFDCGEATQHHILDTKVKLSKVMNIFVTHLHGDHIFGLPGLLGSRSFQGGERELHLYGPPGIRDYIQINLQASFTHLTYPIEITEVEEGRIFEDESRYVLTTLLDHVVPSLGYRIVEKDKPGSLLKEKIKKELGLSPGPLYKAFKEQESVILPNGQTVRTTEYIGPSKKGRSIAILGDTRPCQASVELARNADILVHEGTFTQEKEEGANEFGHSSARQAAVIAKAAHVKQLILTHISARYQETDALLAEAKAIFPDTVIAEDFWSYEF
ncbi:MAG: ribonuclease Z [Tuberibacillus sp.]